MDELFSGVVSRNWMASFMLKGFIGRGFGLLPNITDGAGNCRCDKYPTAHFLNLPLSERLICQFVRSYVYKPFK